MNATYIWAHTYNITNKKWPIKLLISSVNVYLRGVEMVYKHRLVSSS